MPQIEEGMFIRNSKGLVVDVPLSLGRILVSEGKAIEVDKKGKTVLEQKQEKAKKEVERIVKKVDARTNSV